MKDDFYFMIRIGDAMATRDGIYERQVAQNKDGKTKWTTWSKIE